MELAAVAEASPYTGPVVWVTLILGSLFLLAGLVVALIWEVPADVRAAQAATSAGKKANEAAQGKVDAVAQGRIADTAKAAADLANALKNLTTAGRLALIGVFLVGVAAVAAGADALG